MLAPVINAASVVVCRGDKPAAPADSFVLPKQPPVCLPGKEWGLAAAFTVFIGQRASRGSRSGLAHREPPYAFPTLL